MKLKHKLLICFLGLAVVLIVPLLISVDQSRENRALINRLVQINIVEVEFSARVAQMIHEIKSNVREVMLDKALALEEHRLPDFVQGIKKDLGKLEQTAKSWELAVKMDLNESLDDEASEAKERLELSEIEDVLAVMGEFVQGVEHLFAMTEESAATAEMIHDYFETTIEPVSIRLQNLVEEMHNEALQEATDEATLFETELSETETTIVMIMAVSFALCAIAALYLSQLITAPLKRLTEVTARITADDLSERVELGIKSKNDEFEALARRFNAMLDLLATNIATRENVESELRELNAHLEERVKERTATLEEAQKAAERANRAKSDFLSSMSHELRTPLNAILGFGQLMQHSRNHPLDGKQKKSVGQIVHAGKFLLALIDQLLELSKIESGEIKVHMEKVDARSIIDESLALISVSATQKEVTVQDCTKDKVLPAVWADKTRFCQVLLNLLSNAVKYNKAGGSVMLSSIVQFGNLRILIADTGVGIEEHLHDKLFLPFERLGHEASVIQGTGIGLAISKKFVDKMGGSIGYESCGAQGSVFWVELPAYDFESVPLVRRDETAGAPKTEMLKDGDAHTILYVEDNIENIKLMRDVISEATNCRFLVAQTALEGLELAVSEKPDLILMDICLPGMSGFEALDLLKSEKATQNIPVIAVSASAMPDDIKKGLAAGFKDYITKPFDLLDMIGKVKKALEKEGN